MIGSGPIVIGQAAEFDYAGTQACRSLKEEGVEVVLLNSNPATIMTDKDIADKVYIEPLTVEVVEQLILKEKPDSVLPTLGGQAGLNLAMELEERGFLKEHNVRLIGTTSQTIKKAEDRQEFKDTMEKIGEPVAASLVVHDGQAGKRAQPPQRRLQRCGDVIRKAVHQLPVLPQGQIQAQHHQIDSQPDMQFSIFFPEAHSNASSVIFQAQDLETAGGTACCPYIQLFGYAVIPPPPKAALCTGPWDGRTARPPFPVPQCAPVSSPGRNRKAGRPRSERGK